MPSTFGEHKFIQETRLLKRTLGDIEVQRTHFRMNEHHSDRRTNPRDGFEDPLSFVLDYSRRNNLPLEPGGTLIEQECARRSERARQEYKEQCTEIERNNDLRLVGDLSKKNRRDALSAAQKYGIRLRNNRKSAHASKVFEEVMKRELSRELSKRICNTPPVHLREGDSRVQISVEKGKTELILRRDIESRTKHLVVEGEMETCSQKKIKPRQVEAVDKVIDTEMRTCEENTPIRENHSKLDSSKKERFPGSASQVRTNGNIITDRSAGKISRGSNVVVPPTIVLKPWKRSVDKK